MELRLQWRIDEEQVTAVILRRLMRPNREGRKMTRGESSNLDMQSQLVVELDLGWVIEEKEELRLRLGLEVFAGSKS